MSVLSCCKCGRFISYKDFDSRKLKQEDIWSNFDLQEVLTWCLKCTEKENMLPIERDIIRIESLIKKHESGDPQDERDDISELREALIIMKDDLVDYRIQEWKNIK
jgi:negative regulator of genetic competence, sporulation and motility